MSQIFRQIDTFEVSATIKSIFVNFLDCFRKGNGLDVCTFGVVILIV